MRADLLASERCLMQEKRGGGDRWRPDKHKLLARRRLLKAFVCNYVMEHDKSLIGGCDHMLQAPACLCIRLQVICQSLHESTCSVWIFFTSAECVWGISSQRSTLYSNGSLGIIEEHFWGDSRGLWCQSMPANVIFVPRHSNPLHNDAFVKKQVIILANSFLGFCFFQINHW